MRFRKDNAIFFGIARGLGTKFRDDFRDFILLEPRSRFLEKFFMIFDVCSWLFFEKS